MRKKRKKEDVNSVSALIALGSAALVLMASVLYTLDSSPANSSNLVKRDRVAQSLTGIAVISSATAAFTKIRASRMSEKDEEQ